MTKSDDALTRWLAAATEIAASTGPAQGMNTKPRLRPMMKPPPELAWLVAPKRLKGRSINSPTIGIMRPTAKISNNAMPNQKSRS